MKLRAVVVSDKFSVGFRLKIGGIEAKRIDWHLVNHFNTVSKRNQSID